MNFEQQFDQQEYVLLLYLLYKKQLDKVWIQKWIHMGIEINDQKLSGYVKGVVRGLQQIVNYGASLIHDTCFSSVFLVSILIHSTMV